MRSFRGLKTLAVLSVLSAIACSPEKYNYDKKGSDGLSQNGLSQNGLSQNGLSQNGLSQNGLSQNGLSQNGLSQNGLSQNGLSQNGLSQNGLSQNGLSALDIMKGDANARDLFKYVYSCAMPSGSTLDLDLGGTVGKVTFSGGLGLAPEWGADNGTCNATCQRWVSACVLARTNAFGAHVALSLRGNNPALAVSAQELADYPVREGTYFGNIFATSPVLVSNGLTTTTNGYINTPRLYACAGPGSDLAYETLRFCSSTSDDCAIQSVANCTEPSANGTIPAACSKYYDDVNSKDVGGAPSHCTSPVATDKLVYDEAITVYLKAPAAGDTFAVCGNNVCETSQGENSSSCAEDCHSDSWADQLIMFGGTAGHSFTGSFNESDEIGLNARGVALCPNDNGIAVSGYTGSFPNLGSFNNTDGVDVIGVPQSTDGPLPQPATGPGFLARYYEDGSLNWSDFFTFQTDAVAADAAGNVAVTGLQYGPAKIGYSTVTAPQTGNPYLMIAKFDIYGNTSWTTQLGMDSTANVRGSRGLRFDGAGNLLVGGTVMNAGTAGTGNISVAAGNVGPVSRDVFVAKYGTDGQILWARVVGTPSTDVLLDLSLDKDGNALVTTGINNGYGLARTLYKLSGLDGTTLWSKSSAAFGGLDISNGAIDPLVIGTTVRFDAAGADLAGNVYLTGTFSGVANFGGEGFASAGDSVFLAKYDANGVYQWARATQGGATPTEMTIFQEPTSLAPVILLGGRSFDINLGAGRFHSNTADLFLSAYTSAGEFLWAKQYPMFGVGTLDGGYPANGPSSGVGGFFTGIGVDNAQHVVTSGLFDGFMFADNNILVNWKPTGVYQGDVFLNSFGLPCSYPDCDTVDPVLSNTPASFTVQATGSGTAVWYVSPTATDDQPDGVTVSCNPAPGSNFPAGNSTVTCTATDAHGNTTTSSFVVNVVNNVPPTMTLPSGYAELIAAPSKQLTFTVTAIDQVDGVRPVTCTGTGATTLGAFTPSVGATFNLGDTTVTCSAIDHPAGNSVSGRFVVHLAPVAGYNPNPPDTTPPVVTVPAGITVSGAPAAGLNVTYPTVTALDAKDGARPVTCSKASGSLFPIGTTFVTCTAKDVAGNTGTGTFTVTVSYSWAGVNQPINNDGSSIFKQGSTIPVKFDLTTANGTPITSAMAELGYAKISNGIAGSVTEATSTSGADSGNDFRVTGNQYHYNLSTKFMSAGTYLLIIDLHDGASHSVKISIKP